MPPQGRSLVGLGRALMRWRATDRQGVRTGPRSGWCAGPGRCILPSLTHGSATWADRRREGASPHNIGRWRRE